MECGAAHANRLGARTSRINASLGVCRPSGALQICLPSVFAEEFSQLPATSACRPRRRDPNPWNLEQVPKTRVPSDVWRVACDTAHLQSRQTTLEGSRESLVAHGTTRGHVPATRAIPPVSPAKPRASPAATSVACSQLNGLARIQNCSQRDCKVASSWSCPLSNPIDRNTKNVVPRAGFEPARPCGQRC